ncbi:dermonecrotic toxin domain-containing protein [Pseudomonas tremae]
MNATLPTPPDPLKKPPDSETCLPDLAETVGELVHEALRMVKPDLNVHAAWLAYRDSRLPPDADDNVHSAPLIASLIEHFTGKLSWNDNEVQGIYPTPSVSTQTLVIEPLGRTAILTLYAHVRQQLEKRYSQKLADYWAAALPDGKTRRSEFLSDQIQCLRSECAIRIALGKMTTSHYSMLLTVLKRCITEATDETQAHSVYNLRASIDGAKQIALPGAFVITRRFRTQPAQTDDDEREDVLLFTQEDGLEGFNSFKQMNDSLIGRGNEPRYSQRFQALLTLEEPEPTADSPMLWSYTSMAGNFLSQLLTLQIIRQQGLFAIAVQRALAERMDMACFEQLIWQLLKPELQLDNCQRLEQMDSELIQTQMPDWWQTMEQKQRKEWCEQAQRFGEAVVNIHSVSKDRFDRPEVDGRLYFARYIDQQLNDALKRASVELAAERIMVSLTYGVRQIKPEIPGFNGTPVIETRTMSLRHLMHSPVFRVKARHALLIGLTDDTGKSIEQLDKLFVKNIVAAIHDPQHLDSYLDDQLRSSAYAQQLKRSRQQLLESQMRMRLLEIEQQAFPLSGSTWIKAVLDAPAPERRRTVNSEKIEVRLLSINQLTISNVMLIAPVDKFEKGPLVLCTLDASDGVVFRWFNSMFHLTQLLEDEPFQRYLMRQIPVSRRMEMLYAMKYEKEAKHWRLPEIITRFSPIKFPAGLFRPIVFIPQSNNFYEENHKTKINLLIQEAKQRMSPAHGTGQSGNGFDFTANIVLLFLPDAILMPLALGLALYKTWSAFEKIEENDIRGAADEFLSAISYLAIALLGHVALVLKPAVRARAAIRRPNLIRQIGRDGQPQIGYLMSHTGAPRFGESKLTVALVPKRFTAIELENQTFYVSRRNNLFGHSRLYRQHPIDATLLVHEHEYALRTTSGAWKVVSEGIPRLSPQAIRKARARLASLLTDWPSSLQETTAAERMAFEADYIALSKTSNAEGLPAITAYAEGGSGEINPLLRSGVRNATTREFLDQFHRLKEWHGTAFRATYVSSEGLACLEGETGAVFMDNGVQSASVSRTNALEWSQDEFVTRNANAENHPVFFIFAPAVPKKNMFTDFLGDHVAIPPSTFLQLGATSRVNGQLYAYFDIPEQVMDQAYDLYSGEKELWV